MIEINDGLDVIRLPYPPNATLHQDAYATCLVYESSFFKKKTSKSKKNDVFSCLLK